MCCLVVVCFSFRCVFLCRCVFFLPLCVVLAVVCFFLPLCVSLVIPAIVIVSGCLFLAPGVDCYASAPLFARVFMFWLREFLFCLLTFLFSPRVL